MIIRATWLPILVALLLGAGWMNQGIAASRVRAILAPGSAVGAVHKALLNVYQRSGDEELYFAVAQALRGQPYDHKKLTDRGRDTPASFQMTPPEDGHWHRPFAEVPVEYPPAMLPFVVLPGFFAHDDFAIYSRLFAALMTLFLLASAALVIRAQPARDDRERWWWMAGMMLAQGALAVQRLDAIIAFALALTLWAAASKKPATVGGTLGLATAAKFLPALLSAPLVAADREAWSSRRSRLRGAVAFTAALVVGFLPMLLAPGGFLEVLRYHGRRGLQIESTYAILVSTYRLFTGTLVPTVLSYGSFNLEGPTAAFFARISTLVTLGLVTALTVWIWRAPPATDDTAWRDRLALSLLAGVTALWMSGKVFSPQYLTWAMPLVLGVSGKRGRTLTVLLFAIYWVTQYMMTGDYGNVKDQTPLGIMTLLVRLPLLIAFGVIVVRGLWQRASESQAVLEAETSGLAATRV